MFQDTSYLKNQVKNERDRQMQWKDLYFKAHAELMDIKRHNPSTNNSQSRPNNNVKGPPLEGAERGGGGGGGGAGPGGGGGGGGGGEFVSAWTPRTPRTRTVSVTVSGVCFLFPRMFMIFDYCIVPSI